MGLGTDSVASVGSLDLLADAREARVLAGLSAEATLLLLTLEGARCLRQDGEIGALAAGALSDKFGRKRLLIGSALLFAVTSIGNGLAGTFAVFVTWRMLGGVAIGLAEHFPRPGLLPPLWEICA